MDVRLKPRYAVLFFFSMLSATSGCSSGSGYAAKSSDARIVYQNLASNISTSNFLVTLSATILPPTVTGTTLDANDIFQSGVNVYTTYNIPGAAHMGGVDIINVTVPVLPVRTATTTFATSTVNSLYVDSGGKMNIVGSTTDTLTSGWPAYLAQLTLSGSTISAMVNETGLLNTYAGTGITGWNGSLYAISGANGASTSQGVSVLNSTTLAQTASISIADARAIHYYAGGGTNLYVLAGGGNLYEINSANSIVHTIVTGGNTITESKSTVQVGKTMVAVSLGDGGAKIICQGDQKTLASIPAQTVAGIDPTLTVTNAVAAGPGLLFTANGQAGVYVYSMTATTATTSTCKNVGLTLLGKIDLGSTTYSANNVRFGGLTLYVATGLGGFKVITITTLAPLLFANNDFL